MTTGRSLPVKLRWEILERDRFTCTYCGRPVSDGIQLHVDHVVPWADGGSDHRDNLVTACADCNLGKARRYAKVPLPTGAADAYLGAACPTRLRIATIAAHFGMTYANSLRMALGAINTFAPPPDRRDGQWMTIVRSDPTRFTRWCALAMDAKLGDGPPAPPFI